MKIPASKVGYRCDPGHQQVPVAARRARPRGAVLLEVVLALVLFAAAAAIVGGGMTSSLNSVDRLRRNLHAADLAVSVLSELQMGTRSTLVTGPAPFDPPFENWTWELLLAPVQDEWGETSPLTQVEVVIRHEDPPVVYRLAQVLNLEHTIEQSETLDVDFAF